MKIESRATVDSMAPSPPSAATMTSPAITRMSRSVSSHIPQVSDVPARCGSEENAQDRTSLRAANYLLRELVGLVAIPGLKSGDSRLSIGGTVRGRDGRNDGDLRISIRRQSSQATLRAAWSALRRYFLGWSNKGQIRTKGIKIALQYIHVIGQIYHEAFRSFRWSGQAQRFTAFVPMSQLFDQRQCSCRSRLIHVRNAQYDYSTAPEVILIPVSIPLGIVLWTVNFYRTAKGRIPEIKDPVTPQALSIPSGSQPLEFIVHPRLSARMATPLPVFFLPHSQIGCLLFVDRPVQFLHFLARFRYSSNARRIISDRLIPRSSAITRKAAIWVSGKYKFMRYIYSQYTPVVSVTTVAGQYPTNHSEQLC
jgi:hypothetical protein